MLLATLHSDQSLAQVGISAGLESISNPLRTPVPAQAELLQSLSADLTVARQTERFDTAVSYRVNRQEYREEVLQDRTLADGSAVLSWNVMPDTLAWAFSNSRSNQLIDVSAPDVADNRQIIDYTTTGPSMVLPLGAANLLNFGANYSLVSYEESGLLDQVRTSLNAGVRRNLGRRLVAGIQSNYSETDFDAEVTTNFRVMSISATAEYATDRYGFNLEAGQHKSSRANLRSSNPVFSAGARYRVNSMLNLTAEYSRSVQDLISELREGSINRPLPGVEPVPGFEDRFGSSNIAELYLSRSRSITASYSQRGSYTVNLSYSNDARSSEESNRQDKDERISVDLRVPFSPRLSWNARTQYSVLTPSRALGDQERRIFSLGAVVLINKQMNLVLSGTETRQTGDLPSDNYDGRNISLTLSYRRQ